MSDGLSEDGAAEAPGVRVAHVIDPALNAGVELGKRNVPGLIRVEIAAEAASEIHNVAAFEATVRGEALAE